ncbi:MAG: (Fe-S)-binding protein [Opitutae bacterium]|nr:(Fe-S)-binding protein [Opitutae bacterium]
MTPPAELPAAPTVKENPSFEILYWVGCAASYDRRAQRVARAMVRLLRHAGVNFAILGKEEKCTGDSARRLGDEFLFQELATANIETLNRYNVKRIVAHCPHCVNALLKDYAQFGGHYEVVHHTQLLAELIRAGKLPAAPDAKLRNTEFGGDVTYHDPCYLARVNGIHEAPREVLATAIGGKSLCEMKRSRANTSCCGAGGGRMWMEEEPKQRVSTQRAGEALATGAKTVATGCPFCLTMMTDGVAANGAEARVLDIAELLVERLGLNPPTPATPTAPAP